MKTFMVSMAFWLWGMVAFVAMGQDAKQGLIFDAQTKEPLPGVTLSWDGGKSGIVTDANGHFSLTSMPTKVTVSAVGYRRQEVT